MKIALFKNTKYDFESIGTEQRAKNDEYIRLTHYVDVDFEPLDTQEVILKQVDALKATKQNLQAQLTHEMNEIDHKISRLLALPPGAE